MPIVVSFIGQKGGVGKSTCAQALARETTANGLSTVLVDLDVKQRTDLDWASFREETGVKPHVDVRGYDSVQQTLANVGDPDVLILDHPGDTSKVTLASAQLADLAVHPVKCTKADLMPAVRLYNELVKAGVPRTKLCFALFAVKTEPQARAAREFLASAGYTVLDGYLPDAPSLQNAQNDGYAPTEIRFDAMKNHINTLLNAMVKKVMENV